MLKNLKKLKIKDVTPFSCKSIKKGLTVSGEPLDFLDGAEGDRTPDLMTARLRTYVLLSTTQYSSV
jgi:hypothetical protein